MCQYDTLVLEAHFKDSVNLQPLFRWESKMPMEEWISEKIDTAHIWKTCPLSKGKIYRCVVNDTIIKEGVAFKKVSSEIINPLVHPFPDINLISQKSTCLLPNGKIALRTHSDARLLKFFWTNDTKKQDLIDAPAGIYSVLVLDLQTGCKKAFTDTVGNEFVPPSLFLNTRYAECGLDNGAIDLSVSGNDGPFSYKWSTGAVTEDLSNVGVGVYRITVSNAVGCSTTEKVGISNIASPFRITLRPQTAYCNLANGAIQCQVDGSGSPFRYKWNTGDTTQHLSKCKSGKYYVVVTNQNACTDTAFATVKEAPPLKITLKVQDVDCYQASTGNIITILSDSTNVASYEWSNGSKGKNLIGVSAGTYTLSVRNEDKSCEVKAEATIQQPSAFTASTEIQSLKGLYTLIATPSGGKSPYIYKWNDGQDDNTFVTSQVGIYSVKITDANGCFIADTVEISPYPSDNHYIPNIITANKDGKNDGFYIRGENIHQIDIRIKDVFGNIVFENSKPEIYWDASECGGVDCYQGLYEFSADIQYKNGFKEARKGTIYVQK